jgi:membrane-bound inhibitor of C-type lysozyme
MAITLKQLLAACAVALAGAALAAPASASVHETHPKAVKVLKARAKHGKKAEKKAEPAVDANDPEPDITDTVTTEYKCELGSKVTIYTNDKDSDHIALRWKNRLHRLSRVGTTTGALRFENTAFGIIWIGIPAKGILLDSKHNHQLANECKDAAQSRAALDTETKKG